jgi:DNA topoisomerase-6 subunit B
MARKNAKQMAKGQRAISISEFFAKNQHLLGFDSPKRALLTTVKEAVDNALDACEEAGILPLVEVRIRAGGQPENLVVEVTDNGPGIERKQVGRIFGKLLYGSKFHRLKQSRGQQGIGISAAGMYGMMTTARPVRVTTCTNDDGSGAIRLSLRIDTKKNVPVILDSEPADNWIQGGTGTRVEIEIKGKLVGGRGSVREYVTQTAVANPHASFRYKEPNKSWEETPRGSDIPPREPKEIKPHPKGVELGVLGDMLKETRAPTLAAFMRREFSRVSSALARKTCQKAGVRCNMRPANLDAAQVRSLADAIKATEFPSPPTNCLSPIGEDQIAATLEERFGGEFVCSATRKPSSYRGHPFLVEVGLAYGCSGLAADLEGEGHAPATLLRLANRVPLLYQQGG